MKNILTLFILILISPIQLKAYIPDQIKHAIIKSRPDLLEKALKEEKLTDKQVRKCQLLAKKILTDRENNFDEKSISVKAILPRANRCKLLSGIGALLSLQLFNAFYQLMEEYGCSRNLMGFLVLMIFIESFMFRAIKKTWNYGIELSNNYRKPHEKYLDAFDVDQFFS